MSCPYVCVVPCGSLEVGCDGMCWQHCPFGLKAHSEMRGIAGHATMEQYYRIMDTLFSHAVECHGVTDNRPSKSHVGNGKYLGAWAFTLTKSPADGLSEEDMIRAARKIMNQQSQPVKKYAWYLEYKDGKNHPHIHGIYETFTGRRIEKKHWERAWKIWDEGNKLGKGHRGGYHREVRDGEGYTDYIRKDGGLSESNISPEIIDGDS